jgi:hypothetical protein
MKSLILAFVLAFVGFTTAQAEDHSAGVCVEDTALCLHLGFHQKPVVNAESKFMVHFLVQPDVAAQISNVAVELWMDMGNGHGHGSAPVEVKKMNETHYLASKAYFLMEGEWIVRVTFDYLGESKLIEVPYIIE